MGWHPADYPDRGYFERVRKFRKDCEQLGYKGDYFCNEVYAGSSYPPGPQEGNQFRYSDMGEAKYLTRSLAGHGSLNIMAGNCHVHFTGFPHPQALCRTTVPSQVVAPSQPKPSYYCIRNLATAIDDFYEADFPVSFSGGADIVCFTLQSGDKSQKMLIVWTEAPPVEELVEAETDITLPGVKYSSAWVTDIFNGTEQELQITANGEDTVLKGVLVKDYPVLIKLLP